MLTFAGSTWPPVDLWVSPAYVRMACAGFDVIVADLTRDFDIAVDDIAVEAV